MMPRPIRHVRPSSRARLVLCAALAAVSSAVVADNPPVFKPGLWEFKRTVEDARLGGEPLELEDRRCADPTAEMRDTSDTLALQGCKVSPVSRAGNRYSFDYQCDMQGTRYESHSVITVESDGAYRAEITGRGGESSSKEVLRARRVGDCPP